MKYLILFFLSYNSYAIIKGKLDLFERYPNVIEFTAYKGKGKVRSCTALVVNERVLLTAAHCLLDGSLALISSERIKSFYTMEKTKRVLIDITPSRIQEIVISNKVFSDNSYCKKNKSCIVSEFDIGAIIFNKEVNILDTLKIKKLLINTDGNFLNSKTFCISGYGRSTIDSFHEVLCSKSLCQKNNIHKRQYGNVLLQLDKSSLVTPYSLFDEKDESARFENMSAQLFAGDSGAGLFDESNTLLAIGAKTRRTKNVWRDGKVFFKLKSVFAPLFLNKDFLENVEKLSETKI